MKFTKMNGAGNDFVLLDEQDIIDQNKKGYSTNELAKKLCDRHFGIGADGLEFPSHSHIADIKYNYYNSDGSRGEMCGNGIRCFSRYIYEKGLVNKTNFAIETDAGIKYITLNLDDNGKVASVSVQMGKGENLETNKTLTIDGKEIEYSYILMGVPHISIFVDDIEAIDINGLGAKIEKHPVFPNKTNVNFVQTKDENTIIQKTWERGCGRTLACGTGTCATATIAKKLGKVKGENIKMILEGGEISININDNYELVMTGPADIVYTGEIDI